MSLADVTADLNEKELAVFRMEYDEQRLNPTTALLLALFLGGFGAHWFYAGRPGLAICYLLFCWTLIPPLIALAECFTIQKRTLQHNEDVARQIVARFKLRS